MKRPGGSCRGLAFFVLVLVSCHPPRAKRPAPLEIDETMPPLPYLTDVIVPKRVSPGSAATVGQTSCGSRMVLRERKGSSTRVTAKSHDEDHGEREETFWIDDTDLERAPLAYEHCLGPLVLRDARVSDALARSLTPPMLQEVDAWETFDPTLPNTFYQRDDDGTSCAEFRLAHHRLTAPTIEWGFERRDDRNIDLTGPTIKDVKLGQDQWHLEPAPGEQVGFLCLESVFIARRTRGAWDMLSTVNLGGVKAEVWAYSPAISRRWFGSRAACEKGLKRGAVAKIPFRSCH